MRYRFKTPHRSFKAGDLVPEAWGSGIIDTLVRANRAEPCELDQAEAAKSITAPPADKSLKPWKAKRKAVGVSESPCGR